MQEHRVGYIWCMFVGVYTLRTAPAAAYMLVLTSASRNRAHGRHRDAVCADQTGSAKQTRGVLHLLRLHVGIHRVFEVSCIMISVWLWIILNHF